MSQSQRQHPFRTRTCDCSMFAGRVHTVKSRLDWRRHLALKATDVRVLTSIAASQPAALELEPEESKDLEGYSGDESNGTSDEGEEAAYVSDEGEEEEEEGDGLAYISEEGEEVEKEGMTYMSNEDGMAYISEDEYVLMDKSTDPVKENLNSRPRVSLPGGVNNHKRKSSLDHYESAPDDEDIPEYMNLDLADDVHPLPFFSGDDASSSSSSSLELILDGDSESSSKESDITGPVGQMNRGLVDVQVVEAGNSTADSEEDLDKVDLRNADAYDDTDMGSMYDNDLDSDSSEFDFKNPRASHPTKSEMLSYALYDIHLTHQVPRDAATHTKNLINSISGGVKVMDYRTVKRRIEKKTGIKEIIYDCCPQSHMSYAMYPDLDSCLHCQHPRWKPSRKNDASANKVPYATHSIISVTHRAKLWYSDPERAGMMARYRYYAEQERSQGLRTDFWSSDLFQDLRQKGLFEADTDLGFMLSTDGVKVFKSRRSFNIWPLLLVCLVFSVDLLPPVAHFD
ncbi:hypothetical protein DFP73DRAFT_524296 [Morchella snyderi]|nr:hypothetical protein DFP73DRAFT_524296 [Morchella snyderi]